ncbi:hypothetical protein OEIGOIKO_06401 [Streptomyces chrestomyceticus JCM 4735]|uniref:Uncharacterized protein n=1 Tax=Streptomyces chrestomyceticus JCM 4735 TaxID=1306181 RepID=A0A7U9Q180_9ACTN|nr:hypothetical protein [Streptomyces chrestomyceticus]GCD38585.1 hypothetical protein OEIGOIKO_06401 [Streptomyces chrestomyceticus JCM 4735]
MRSTRVLTGAALSVAALGLSTCAAFAATGSIEVTPNPVKAGNTVNLNSSACGKNGSATVDASTLGAGRVTLSSKGQTHTENVQGSVRVPASTKPGNYGIGGKCANGTEISGTVRVTSGSTPHGPTRTGVGTTSENSGTTEIVAGAGVLLAAAAGGVWMVRRRRADDSA